MIILFLCFLLFIAVMIFFNRVTICFLSRSKVKECIESNHEFYVRFSDADFSARGVKSLEEYLYKIKPAMSSFTIFEKFKLLYCIYKADQRISQMDYAWYDGEKASRIPWKIGCVNGVLYEDGMPHTIRDTIILYHADVMLPIDELTNTLIHEHVHLYQKRYPEDVRRYLSTKGFTVYKKVEDHDYIRINPDTDDQIYRDKDRIYKAEYKTPTPSFIEDLKKNDQTAEHPFEKMAIDLAKGYY
jgi:hypothetical protein